VDKKICSSVNRKLMSINKQHLLINNNDNNDNKFKFSNLLSRTFKGSGYFDDKTDAASSNDKIIFSVITALIFITVLSIAVLSAVMFHRHRKRKRALTITTLQQQQFMNHQQPQQSIYNQLSNNLRSSSLSNSLSNTSSSDMFCLDESKHSASSNKHNSDKKYASLSHMGHHHKLKINKESTFAVSASSQRNAITKTAVLSDSNEYVVEPTSSDDNGDNFLMIDSEGKVNTSKGALLVDLATVKNKFRGGLVVKASDSYEDLDPEEYGEPPPSYKQAKYYPKALAVASNIETTLSSTQMLTIEPLLATSGSNNQQLQTDRSSNIYENIEDSSSHRQQNNSSDQSRPGVSNSNAATQSYRCSNSTGSSSRRGRFQGLKKQHSSSSRANTVAKQGVEATMSSHNNNNNLLRFSSSSSTGSSTHSSQIIAGSGQDQHHQTTVKGLSTKSKPTASNTQMLLLSAEKKLSGGGTIVGFNEQFL
jgi:hypothetical protein